VNRFIIAVYMFATLFVPQVGYAGENGGGVRISPIFIANRDQEISADTHLAEVSSQANNRSDIKSDEALSEQSTSPMTAGNVLLAIVVGVVIGAVVHAATKPDYVSNAPTSQGTIDMNR